MLSGTVGTDPADREGHAEVAPALTVAAFRNGG